MLNPVDEPPSQYQSGYNTNDVNMEKTTETQLQKPTLPHRKVIPPTMTYNPANSFDNLHKYQNMLNENQPAISDINSPSSHSLKSEKSVNYVTTTKKYLESSSNSYKNTASKYHADHKDTVGTLMNSPTEGNAVIELDLNEANQENHEQNTNSEIGKSGENQKESYVQRFVGNGNSLSRPIYIPASKKFAAEKHLEEMKLGDNQLDRTVRTKSQQTPIKSMEFNKHQGSSKEDGNLPKVDVDVEGGPHDKKPHDKNKDASDRKANGKNPDLPNVNVDVAGGPHDSKVVEESVQDNKPSRITSSPKIEADPDDRDVSTTVISNYNQKKPIILIIKPESNEHTQQEPTNPVNDDAFYKKPSAPMDYAFKPISSQIKKKPSNANDYGVSSLTSNLPSNMEHKESEAAANMEHKTGAPTISTQKLENKVTTEHKQSHGTGMLAAESAKNHPVTQQEYKTPISQYAVYLNSAHKILCGKPIHTGSTEGSGQIHTPMLQHGNPVGCEETEDKQSSFAGPVTGDISSKSSSLIYNLVAIIHQPLYKSIPG